MKKTKNKEKKRTAVFTYLMKWGKGIPQGSKEKKSSDWLLVLFSNFFFCTDFFYPVFGSYFFRLWVFSVLFCFRFFETCFFVLLILSFCRRHFASCPKPASFQVNVGATFVAGRAVVISSRMTARYFFYIAKRPTQFRLSCRSVCLSECRLKGTKDGRKDAGWMQ